MVDIMTDIRVVIRENIPIFNEAEDEGDISLVSTVGVKFRFRERQYGHYIVVKKPTLTATDVVEAANKLLERSTEWVVSQNG